MALKYIKVRGFDTRLPCNLVFFFRIARHLVAISLILIEDMAVSEMYVY